MIDKGRSFNIAGDQRNFRRAIDNAFTANNATGDAADIGAVERQVAKFDFDGDGKSDLSVFRPGNTNWYRQLSSSGAEVGGQFGLASDKIVPADYDGDGKTDVAVYRNGTWYLNRSTRIYRRGFRCGN